jgi:hypothetical protein
VTSLLACRWEDRFYAKLEENFRSVLKGAKECWGLSPKDVKSTVRGGVDTLNMNLTEERDILITSPP